MTKFYAVAPIISESSVWNWLHVNSSLRWLKLLNYFKTLISTSSCSESPHDGDRRLPYSGVQ